MRSYVSTLPLSQSLKGADC